MMWYPYIALLCCAVIHTVDAYEKLADFLSPEIDGLCMLFRHRQSQSVRNLDYPTFTKYVIKPQTAQIMQSNFVTSQLNEAITEVNAQHKQMEANYEADETSDNAEKSATYAFTLNLMREYKRVLELMNDYSTYGHFALTTAADMYRLDLMSPLKRCVYITDKSVVGTKAHNQCLKTSSIGVITSLTDTITSLQIAQNVENDFGASQEVWLPTSNVNRRLTCGFRKALLQKNTDSSQYCVRIGSYNDTGSSMKVITGEECSSYSNRYRAACVKYMLGVRQATGDELREKLH